VYSPSKKIFFNGDAHVLYHDENVLDIQEQFCKDYKPDVVVNLGDVENNAPLNHHEMSRNGWSIRKSILKESAAVHYVLKKMRKWAKKFYLLFGNHERFSKDFTAKMPQFEDLLDFGFITNLESMDIKLIPHKNILKFDGLKFIHGDLKLFGAKGQSKIEKASHVFGNNVVMADVHYPSARFGCYSVGLSGKIDQSYNEPMATRWLQGFGFCNVFEDKCFINVVSVRNNRFSINHKQYKPKCPKSWQPPPFKASIMYDFGK
jgi:predicted phosphodiesterase